MEPRTSLLSRFQKCRVPPPAGENVATITVFTPLQRAGSSAQRSLSEVPPSEGMEISDEYRGMLYNDASPCSNFAPMEWASRRTGKGEDGAASPPSPVLASRPRKFKLVEEERAKQPGILDLDGRAVAIKKISPRCEGSPLQVFAVTPLSESSPSPSFGEPSEQTLGDGEFLPKTSPDRMFSCFCDLPPTPGAPKKYHTLRSAPLRKTQPRRLQFGDEGEDVPLVACSSHVLASNQMHGVGSINPRFSDPSYDGGCREFAPPDDNGREPDDSGLREESSPRTPPDKVFSSFAPGDTPTAPRCLWKSLGASTLKRDWR